MQEKLEKKISYTNGAIATKPDLGNMCLVYETGYDDDIFIKKNIARTRVTSTSHKLFVKLQNPYSASSTPYFLL